MSNERLIQVQPATIEAFAPYGHLLTSQPGDPDGRAITVQRFEDTDLKGGRAFIGLMTYRWREFTFTHMEQHGAFTQAFIPVDGKPAMVVVARPAAGPDAGPDLADLKAFLLDGSQGIMLGRNIWHCPLFAAAEKATYAIITCLETPPESERYLDVAAMAGQPFRLII